MWLTLPLGEHGRTLVQQAPAFVRRLVRHRKLGHDAGSHIADAGLNRDFHRPCQPIQSLRAPAGVQGQPAQPQQVLGLEPQGAELDGQTLSAGVMGPAGLLVTQLVQHFGNDDMADHFRPPMADPDSDVDRVARG